MSLIDDAFLTAVLPGIERARFAAIRVRGLGTKLHTCTESSDVTDVLPGF